MNAAAIVAAYNNLRADYDAERAEARACGHEFPTFEQWTGTTCPKAEAQERLMAGGNIWDMQDQVEDN